MRAEPRRVAHIGAAGNLNQVLRAGNIARGLRAADVEVVPAGRVVVEEHKASRATSARRAAHLGIEGSGVGANHRPRGTADNETSLAAATAFRVDRVEIELGSRLSCGNHRRLLL